MISYSWFIKINKIEISYLCNPLNYLPLQQMDSRTREIEENRKRRLEEIREKIKNFPNHPKDVRLPCRPKDGKAIDFINLLDEELILAVDENVVQYLRHDIIDIKD